VETVVKKAKKAVKEGKTGKKLSPLEAARLAKKSGKAPKAKGKKKGVPTWTAPEDFKPFFLAIDVRTDKDGLFSSAIKGTRFQGKYDPQAPDKKKFDLGSYDQETLQGILARLSGPTFKANIEKRYPEDIKERTATEKVKVNGETKIKLIHRTAKRLPANTGFKLLLRVTKKAADSSLAVRFVWIQQGVKSSKTGNIKGVELEKTDPVYRAIRKTARSLPGAFKKVQMPPKKTRNGKKKDADEE